MFMGFFMRYNLLRYLPQAKASPVRLFNNLFSVMSNPASIPPAAVEPGEKSFSGKRSNFHRNGPGKRQKSKRERSIKEGSSEEVLHADIRALLASRQIDATAKDTADAGPEGKSAEEILPEPGSDIEVEVAELSSTGDGLAFQKGSKQVYVVPFTVPGDTVKVKVYRHLQNEHHSVADFISVIKPSALRDDSRVKCKYFSQCSGCQFQMLEYDEQLKLKKRIVERAFKNFSQLPPELIPAIQDTIGSPLQYGYRTKLTPHFDGPPGHKTMRRKGPRTPFESCPDIGFMQKGRRKVIDIEDCPIGTDIVRLGMERERGRMAAEYGKFERGATILLRESTQRYAATDAELPTESQLDTIRLESDSHTDIKSCITDNNAMTTEYVDSYVFTNPAGSFFQNNNSILPVFTNYIREHIMPPPSSTKIKNLIDAYSGSGLFTITLSSLFEGSMGIDIAANSIECARKNAKLNKLEESQCTFIAADAPQLFKNVKYDPDETVVVLDPPRKGCDADFLGQLLRFGPRRVVYVSCNVHTQARDIGVLVRGDGGNGKKYDIESLRGFDFFPQTGHVEGVAVLDRSESS
jgi:tRNA (uracil-5-)-methyltransferase